MNVKKTIAYPAQAGAVDEECFITSFEDVPTVNLFSAKDLEEQMKIIKDTVGDDKKDWKQRMDSVCVREKIEISSDYISSHVRRFFIRCLVLLLQMRKLRAIVLAGGTNYENFHECLKNIQRPLDQACTDLRSQVAREACITLAFLSQSLKIKFASFGETVLLTLMNLIQNSAKVSLTEC